MTRDEERTHWLAVMLADQRRDLAEKHEALVFAEERRAKAQAQLDRLRSELDAARTAANAGPDETCAQAIDRLRAWAKEQHEGCTAVEAGLTAEVNRLRTEIYAARCAAGVDRSPQTLAEGVERLRERAEKAEAELERAKGALSVALAERRLSSPLVWTTAAPTVPGCYLYSDADGETGADVFDEDGELVVYVAGDDMRRSVASMTSRGGRWAGPLVAMESTASCPMVMTGVAMEPAP